MTWGSGSSSERRFPCRVRVSSFNPRSGKDVSSSTFRANNMPDEPIAGFNTSLQIPVTVRQRISSPLQTWGPLPPTLLYEVLVDGSLISGHTFNADPFTPLRPFTNSE